MCGLGFCSGRGGDLWIQDEKNVIFSRADVQELHKEKLQVFSNVCVKHNI